jgi:uncharacterized protein
METHPVVWFEVLGRDASSLRRFYGELFGWKIEVGGPMEYGTVTTGGDKGIPGGVGKVHEGTRSWVTFYVRASDIPGALARAEKLGGKVILPRQELPDGPPIGFFEDPEGHIIGLVEMPA